ncbi:MAG: hypothetical protein OXD30_12710, partial [Bryobacterales bacterium]|nr:hypothetical protein [Bryobacterales bacterium]
NGRIHRFLLHHVLAKLGYTRSNGRTKTPNPVPHEATLLSAPLLGELLVRRTQAVVRKVNRAGPVCAEHDYCISPLNRGNLGEILDGSPIDGTSSCTRRASLTSWTLVANLSICSVAECD